MQSFKQYVISGTRSEIIAIKKALHTLNELIEQSMGQLTKAL